MYVQNRLIPRNLGDPIYYKLIEARLERRIKDLEAKKGPLNWLIGNQQLNDKLYELNAKLQSVSVIIRRRESEEAWMSEKQLP